MKFRIAFSVSKTERKLRLRFWKWDIWRFDSCDDFETAIAENSVANSSKAGFLSFKKISPENELESKNKYNKLLFQALFYPKVEERIWAILKKLICLTYRLFSVNFEKVEIRGSIGDPFYNAIALGMSGGCYYPDWENENSDWSAKGEIVLRSGFFHLIFFVVYVLYAAAKLAFILWRGTKLAQKNPNGEDLSSIRRWCFLKAREAV